MSINKPTVAMIALQVGWKFGVRRSIRKLVNHNPLWKPCHCAMRQRHWSSIFWTLYIKKAYFVYELFYRIYRIKKVVDSEITTQVLNDKLLFSKQQIFITNEKSLGRTGASEDGNEHSFLLLKIRISLLNIIATRIGLN